MPAISTISQRTWGMGFIEHNKAFCMLSVLINTQILSAAMNYGVNRYFFSSSACVYNGDKQKTFEALSLKEEDAYPALAEDGYGWEKYFLNGCAGIPGSAPKGVNGRNSDNTLVKKYLKWKPNIPLRTDPEKTYVWIDDLYMARQRGESAVEQKSSSAR